MKVHDIALVGAGRMGGLHARNLALSPRFRLVGIADHNEKLAAELADELHTPVRSYGGILGDPLIEAVVVASSTSSHLENVLLGLASGKAVFCEKPLSLDADTLASALPDIEHAARPVFIAFNRRFDPNFRQIHDRIASGEMGQLETLHIISHDPAPPPIDYVKVSGGMFKDMTIHDFDMARWLLGEDPVEVYSAATAVIDPAIGAAGDVDTAKILLRTASGRICVISNSRRSGYGYDQRIEAFCAKGLLRAGNVLSSTVESWGESGAKTDPLQNFFLDRYAGAYRAEMDHFSDILSSAVRPMIGYGDGLAALAIAEAAMESHLESRTVANQY